MRATIARLVGTGLITVLCCLSALHTALAKEKIKPIVPATVQVQTGQKDCAVDIDSQAASKTNETGALTFTNVEPGDHYLHIACPEGKNLSLLISPAPGERVKATSDEGLPPENQGMEIAEIQMQLREHIHNAVQLRARGRIDEAAAHLRSARRLDPANSDLHRELGITFLVGKDWKRARIEMLEAIRSDPADAEAYNGLGYALEKLGMIDAAVEAFHMATKLEPSDTSYRRQYFESLGRQVEARAAQNPK